MANNRTFERDARVEVYVDGAWVPALIKNVSPASGSVAGSGAFTYTVQVDLAGQPQFTDRPVRNYPLMKGVSADSLREAGSKADSSDVVDAARGNNDSVEEQTNAYAKFIGIPTLAEYRKKHGLDDSGMKKSEKEDDNTIEGGFQQAVKSDKKGNVTHGANASVQFVGDVTGTNGTGSVNANGEVPGALPNTPVNETPYTVEASNDPHLGLHLTNLPNTGVEPRVNAVDGKADEVKTKTGNKAPVNPTQEKGKDGKVIASEDYDGAIASATPVGSKDDHQVAAEDMDKQNYEAIDNKPLNEGKVDPAKEADGSHGSNTADFATGAEERAKESEKMTDEGNKDMKPTKAQADSVADVQSATGDKNPQLPATKSDVTDSSAGKK